MSDPSLIHGERAGQVSNWRAAQAQFVESVAAWAEAAAGDRSARRLALTAAAQHRALVRRAARVGAPPPRLPEPSVVLAAVRASGGAAPSG